MRKEILKDQETIIAFCFLAFSILFLIGGRDPLLQKGITDSYGASFFPNIFAVSLLLLSVATIYYRIRSLSEERTVIEQTPRKLVYLFLVAILASMVLYFGGFIVMGVVVTFLLCRIISLSIKESVILSLVLSLGIYLLFNVLLRVQLPKGILF